VAPTPIPRSADLVVVGAGIVGLATARAYQQARPDAHVVVVDKEPTVAGHQSGHNSGVIHAGLYYRPGSRKAELCASGRLELISFCERHDIAWQQCGKVVVATGAAELEPLAALEARARANGIEVHRLDHRGLAEHEPHAAGLAALHVPSTAVVDFRAVCAALADDVRAAGGTILLGRHLESAERHGQEVVVRLGDGEIRTRQMANCAGLGSDRVVTACGEQPPARILPFRGEYAELVPERRHLVRHLIYPVPDARFPFLGMHLSRTIDGHVHAGPNAVLALAREGYRWRDVNWRDVAAMARDGATWRLARRYWRTGAGEMTRSLSRRRMLRSVQRLVPDLRLEDLRPGGSGVRAQAVSADGTLLDDFVFAGDDRIVHVVNAPSPAATASLAIGRTVAARLTG
jgi:L-2-hydroxyglutarate oxidase